MSRNERPSLTFSSDSFALFRRISTYVCVVCVNVSICVHSINLCVCCACMCVCVYVRMCARVNPRLQNMNPKPQTLNPGPA